MKKPLLFPALIALLFALCLPTQAVTLSNEGKEITAPVEAQAQMLKELGLFQGTEKGFELERGMTRDEAAAMLVRYLGAEDKALAGSWKHPFTDVPQWADKYIGWLYASGLTKGVSKTKYGAAEKVTAEQFCIFLSRAASGNDEYSADIAEREEIKSCDKAGFTRGDAVALSVRALLAHYSQHENSISMAQFMIDHGMFTADVFKTAAWDVLPREYSYSRKRADDWLGENRLSCTIAEVCVLRNEASEAMPLYDPHGCAQLYGTDTSDSRTKLYRIDRNTLATEKLAEYEPHTNIDVTGAEYERYVSIDVLGSAQNVDYLAVWGNDDRAVIHSVQGSIMTALPHKLRERDRYETKYGEDSFAYPTQGGTCIVDANGAHLQTLETAERVFALQGDSIITQQSSEIETVIRCRATDMGTVLDSYTVKNALDMSRFQERMDSEAGKNYVLSFYMPSLTRSSAPYLWGTAGLYSADNGRLTQITARPVLDYAFDATDGSYVLVTHRPEKRVEYDAQAVSWFAGDMLVRLHADGTETVLLEDNAAYALLLDQVPQAANGRVVFTHLIGTEPRRMGAFTMVLENGKIRVTEATNDIYFMWGKDALQNEQKRLDDLGVGVGA